MCLYFSWFWQSVYLPCNLGLFYTSSRYLHFSGIWHGSAASLGDTVKDSIIEQCSKNPTVHAILLLRDPCTIFMVILNTELAKICYFTTIKSSGFLFTAKLKLPELNRSVLCRHVDLQCLQRRDAGFFGGSNRVEDFGLQIRRKKTEKRGRCRTSQKLRPHTTLGCCWACWLKIYLKIHPLPFFIGTISHVLTIQHFILFSLKCSSYHGEWWYYLCVLNFGQPTQISIEKN